jgi:threonine/homoserine/homoserine lactone efflux protein
VDAFSTGVALGFAIAAPVGPIGILCLRRAIAGGFFAGLISGLGAACADAVYAAAAACALTFVAALLARAVVPLHVAGGIALVVLGARTAFAPLGAPAERDQRVRAGWRAFVGTFALTIVNPATILSFGAVIAAVGFGVRPLDARGAALLVAGVFLGSTAWWCVLSGLAGGFRRALSPAALRAIDVASGVALGAFGLWSLAGAL